MTASARRSTRSALALLVTVVVGALFAAGCSSDKESASSTTTTASRSGDDQSKFRIGLEAPLSGSQAELGKGMLEGARFAAAELNKGGGFDGREVEIVPIDDQADPDVGVDAATEAIAAGLDAVVGPYNSGVGAVTLPLYIDAGLVPLRLTSADDTAGLGFTLQPMTSQIAPVAVKATTDWAKADSVGIIYDSTQEYTDEAAKATQNLLEAAQVEVTSSVSIEPGENSYSDALDEILEAKPDMVYVVTYYPEAGVVAKDLASRSTDVKCLVDYGGFDNGYITTAGAEAAQRCQVVGVPAPSDFPESESYIEHFRSETGSEPGSWSPYTYDSVMLIVETAKAAGGTEPEVFSEALAATDGWTGWTGTVAFEAETGNREPAPVTVNKVDADGTFTVDDTWATAVGFTTATSDGSAHDAAHRTGPEATPNVEGHISMTSAESTLLKVGPDAQRTYGWNRLVGPTKTQLGDFDVEMLGNVDYLDGNGRFFGFLTYTAPSGDSYGMRMDGQATVNEDGSSTLHAELDVIGGTGTYANVTGIGSFDGSREAVVGAPIEIDVKLSLEGVKG